MPVNTEKKIKIRDLVLKRGERERQNEEIGRGRGRQGAGSVYRVKLSTPSQRRPCHAPLEANPTVAPPHDPRGGAWREQGWVRTDGWGGEFLGGGRGNTAHGHVPYLGSPSLMENRRKKGAALENGDSFPCPKAPPPQPQPPAPPPKSPQVGCMCVNLFVQCLLINCSAV